MSRLQKMGTGQGYLKAGFFGFAKSGKTYTATHLACGLRNHLGLDGPIVMFDTEGGSEYVAPIVKAQTDTELLGMRARSFDDLMDVAHECAKVKASVLIVDSMTHPWRELCEAHLKGMNEVLRAKGRPPRTRLEFQDWANIKARWAPWPDWYLNSPMHVIICGRAGYEFDFEDRADGSGKDLIKTGVKMKTEGEFGFEPSLLVEMERIQEGVEDRSQTRIVHRAMVIGDRFAVLDGKLCDNPGFDFFLPHIHMLTPGENPRVDTEVKSNPQIADSGDALWVEERRNRKILCEEIEGELLRAWPGQTKDEKSAKSAAIESAFGSRSWTYVESLTADELRKGLEKIKAIVTGTEVDSGADPRTA